MAGLTANLEQMRPSRISFLLQHQIHVAILLRFASEGAAAPAIEHPSDANVPRIAGHSDLAVLMPFFEVLAIDIEALPLAFLLGMRVNRVFVIADVFAEIASLKCVAVRKISRHLVHHGGGSAFAGSKSHDFHRATPRTKTFCNCSTDETPVSRHPQTSVGRQLKPFHGIGWHIGRGCAQHPWFRLSSYVRFG